MGSDSTDFAPMRFSTRNLPERDRLPYWREFFAGKIVHLDIEPQSDLPFNAKATLLAWPALRAMWFNNSTPVSYRRTPAMVADGDDSINFFIKHTGLWTASQRGKDVSLGRGDAVGLLSAEPARMVISEVDWLALVVPHVALSPFVRDVEQAVMRLIPKHNEALRLLTKYLGILRGDPALMTPELRRLAVTHIHDLIAMVLGATPEGMAIATSRGLRAARLRAIKADILENLGSLDLTVTTVALRQRVTPRYVHMLFETEGTTFSEFVLDHRLTRTYRMLATPHFTHLTITQIAFAAGFGNLSYFNRTFRRRFGATPSELRHGLRQGDPSV